MQDRINNVVAPYEIYWAWVPTMKEYEQAKEYYKMSALKESYIKNRPIIIINVDYKWINEKWKIYDTSVNSKVHYITGTSIENVEKETYLKHLFNKDLKELKPNSKDDKYHNTAFRTWTYDNKLKLWDLRRRNYIGKLTKHEVNNLIEHSINTEGGIENYNKDLTLDIFMSFDDAREIKNNTIWYERRKYKFNKYKKEIEDILNSNDIDKLRELRDNFLKDLEEIKIKKDSDKPFESFFRNEIVVENNYLSIVNKKIRELTNENNILNESIEIHNELNPKLFDNNKLKTSVRLAVERIANAFVDNLKENNLKFDLKDIVLIGSNVNYNYTKDSDLDIHIIIDDKSVKDLDIKQALYNAYKVIFNRDYTITIKDIPVELYVEFNETKANSNGIYSIKNGWIKEPIQQEIPKLDEEEFNKQVNYWKDRYNKVKRNTTIEEIENLINDIYDLRQKGISSKLGEWSIENQVFKEFRNLGYLDELKELKKQELSKDLSLEKLTESNEKRQKLINYVGYDLANKLFEIQEKLKFPYNDYQYWLKQDIEDLKDFLIDNKC